MMFGKIKLNTDYGVADPIFEEFSMQIKTITCHEVYNHVF